MKYIVNGDLIQLILLWNISVPTRFFLSFHWLNYVQFYIMIFLLQDDVLKVPNMDICLALVLFMAERSPSG